MPPSIWTASSLRGPLLLASLRPDFNGIWGAGGCGGVEGRAGKGPRGEGRRSAVSGCHAALPAPPPGAWERSRARGRGPGAWGRGRAGFRASRAAPGARWPPELGADPSARKAARHPPPVHWAAAPAAAARLPGRGARPAMEPSHKDAETAAAAAAVAAAERGASSSSGVVVQVREKKGPLRAAIPYMPFPVAVICLFLNTFVPGLGTFVSAFTVLCGARTDLPDRHVCCVFWLNIAAALIQILTAIVMVGWIMSIFWGMDMVILANESPYISIVLQQDPLSDLPGLSCLSSVQTTGSLPHHHRLPLGSSAPIFSSPLQRLQLSSLLREEESFNVTDLGKFPDLPWPKPCSLGPSPACNLAPPYPHNRAHLPSAHALTEEGSNFSSLLPALNASFKHHYCTCIEKYHV
uniref:Stum, mechanosensory transduction mediator homolog n=1 Tax=Bos indicus x Bos taurus TaxID=30522 RepID=A0A4W2IJC9_BOBOX